MRITKDSVFVIHNVTSLYFNYLKETKLIHLRNAGTELAAQKRLYPLYVKTEIPNPKPLKKPIQDTIRLTDTLDDNLGKEYACCCLGCSYFWKRETAEISTYAVHKRIFNA